MERRVESSATQGAVMSFSGGWDLVRSACVVTSSGGARAVVVMAPLQVVARIWLS